MFWGANIFFSTTEMLSNVTNLGPIIQPKSRVFLPNFQPNLTPSRDNWRKLSMKRTRRGAENRISFWLYPMLDNPSEKGNKKMAMTWDICAKLLQKWWFLASKYPQLFWTNIEAEEAPCIMIPLWFLQYSWSWWCAKVKQPASSTLFLHNIPFVNNAAKRAATE